MLACCDVPIEQTMASANLLTMGWWEFTNNGLGVNAKHTFAWAGCFGKLWLKDGPLEEKIDTSEGKGDGEERPCEPNHIS